MEKQDVKVPMQKFVPDPVGQMSQKDWEKLKQEVQNSRDALEVNHQKQLQEIDDYDAWLDQIKPQLDEKVNVEFEKIQAEVVEGRDRNA